MENYEFDVKHGIQVTCNQCGHRVGWKTCNLGNETYAFGSELQGWNVWPRIKNCSDHSHYTPITSKAKRLMSDTDIRSLWDMYVFGWCWPAISMFRIFDGQKEYE
jgi:hypothetical protein